MTSASAVTLPAEATELYQDVLRAMNEHGIPYAVAGAFALQKYTGIWRMTKDLDLFVKASDVPAALEHLCNQGFRCETLDPVWLSKAHRGEYFVDLISGMSNATIVVDQTAPKRRIRLWVLHQVHIAREEVLPHVSRNIVRVSRINVSKQH